MIDDNRPLFQLTVSELRKELSEILRINNQAVEPKQTPENKREKINGIRGLAKYLDVSVPTAQRIKNKGRFPFYESGNKVYFFSDEVNNGLKVGGVKK